MSSDPEPPANTRTLDGGTTYTSKTGTGQGTMVVAVPYFGEKVQTTPTPAYAQVLRMGDWDPAIEAGLVDADGAPLFNKDTGTSDSDNKGTGDSKPDRSESGTPELTNKGVLLYSADEATIVAPTIRKVSDETSVEWLAEQSTITTNEYGKVTAYSYLSPDFIANFENVASVSMTAGSTNELIAGNAMEAWTGLNADTGIGLSTSSTYGPSVEIVGGVGVTSNNGEFSVDGLAMAVVARDSARYATESMKLSVNPTKERSLIQARQWATYGKKLAIGLGAVGATFAAAAPIAADVGGTIYRKKLKDHEDALKGLAKDQLDFVAGLFPAIVTVQAAHLLIGLRMLGQSATGMDVDAAGTLSLGVTESVLSQGEGASLTMTSTGAMAAKALTRATVDAVEEVTLMTGTAADPIRPYIMVGPDRIMLYASPESAISLTPEGVIIHGLLNTVGVPAAPINPLEEFGLAPEPPGE